jgi:hypothetical protein
MKTEPEFEEMTTKHAKWRKKDVSKYTYIPHVVNLIIKNTLDCISQDFAWTNDTR